MKRAVFIGLVLALAGVLHAQSGKPAAQAPIFEVDPFWPKPLPNHWVTGSTIGLSVDAQDNVWTIHRPDTVEANFKAADITAGDAVDDEVQPGAKSKAPCSADPIGACCKVAPPVLVYDAAGNLVKSWGGPGAGYDWPDSNHGITVDHKGNVWLAGNGDKDTQVLKFRRPESSCCRSASTACTTAATTSRTSGSRRRSSRPGGQRGLHLRRLRQPPRHRVRRRHRRLQAALGRVRRQAGRCEVPPYNPSAPPSKQFSTVHCVIVSNDGLVYVCDRVNDRIQVFRKDGTFVKEAFIDQKTYRSGSVWDMTFSRDPQQTYIYAANGVDEKINVLLRSTLEVLTSFGDGGRQPGQFFGVHNLATDSKGNLYTAETYTGARVQRFIFKGVGPVTKADQGVPWPRK